MGSSDVWDAGEAYEQYVGRWSRPVARAFLAWLDQPAGLDWLDVGCGTGALAASVVAGCAPRSLIGVDPSPGYLALAGERVADPRARFELGGAEALPCQDDAVDVAVSGLVLNFIPDQARALIEMARVVRPGGTVALYVWDYAHGMQLMRLFWDAAVALDPAAAALDEGVRFPLCRPEPLAGLLRGAGMQAIATCPIEVPTVFADFEDLWSPFLGGQGPAPGYCVGLPEAQRMALRERLRATLPAAADGAIALSARAWAVRGTVP